MKYFEILPHTADLRLKVRSDTLEGLFTSSLQGMNNIIANDIGGADLTGNGGEVVKISSLDESMLLIDFLSEILTLSHKNKCVYLISEISALDETKIEAVLKKVIISGFNEDVKAVTYTEAKITKNTEGIWEIIIVFDI